MYKVIIVNSWLNDASCTYNVKRVFLYPQSISLAGYFIMLYANGLMLNIVYDEQSKNISFEIVPLHLIYRTVKCTNNPLLYKSFIIIIVIFISDFLICY